jgi:hypothetical protein
LERVLAGGNGDGGRQLQPDGGGAHPPAGKQLVMATAVGHRFSMTMDSKLLLFDRIRISLIFAP